MARGTATMFNEFPLELGKGTIDVDSDTWKLGIVDDTITPTAADTTPTWSDYSANEVATTGGYPSGGITLTTVAWAMAGAYPEMTADDCNLAINASGFTDGYWGIVYHVTTGVCAGFVEMDGPVSEQAGAISFEWNGGVVLRLRPNDA